MKIKLVPPSSKYELPENVRVSAVETGIAKVDSVIANYVNATAATLAALGSLTFPQKWYDWKRLREENPWIEEAIARAGGCVIGLLKKQQGGSVPVGAFNFQDVVTFLEAAKVGVEKREVAMEEVEVEI